MAVSWGKIGSFLRKWLGGLAEDEIGDIIEDAVGADGTEPVDWMAGKLAEVEYAMDDGAAKTALSVIRGAIESDGGTEALGVVILLAATYLRANVIDLLDGEDDIPNV